MYERNYDVVIPGSDANTYRECPGNFFGPTDTTFNNHIRNVFLHFLSGNYMQMNCQYMFFMSGLSIGFLICAFKMQKHHVLTAVVEEAIVQEKHHFKAEPTTYPTAVKLQYKRLRRNYLLVLGLSPFIVFICGVGIVFQVFA